MLRSKNGDTSRGKYLSLDEGPILQWQASEAIGPTAYRTNKLRKLVLNGGNSKKLITSAGQLTTVGEDLFPGTLLAMDAESVTLDTVYSGVITIPRSQVASLYPNRSKGKVYYAGPFSDDDWQIIVPNQELQKNRAEAANIEEKAADAVEDALWKFGNGAWYSNSSQPLCLMVPLPDKVSIRFQLAWQNQLHVSFAVMSDFKVPVVPEIVEEDEGEGEDPVPPALEFRNLLQEGTGRTPAENFGSGFMVDLHNNYSRMQKLSFDENGGPRVVNFPTASGRSQLANIYSAMIEIRCDRLSGKVTVLVDGSFYAEWQDEGEVLSAGDRFFGIRSIQRANLQIMDLVVSEWNGMPDSARSMETEERDVLLLANGTDRISGQLLGLANEIFHVKTEFGDFQIPSSDVSEIHLATGTRAKPEKSESDDILVYLQPRGRITLTPHQGQGKDLTGSHSVLNELSIDLDYSYLIEFDPQRTIFDNWDNDF